jgi:carbamate kinase
MQPERWLVAIGGNALADPHDLRDLAHQEEKAQLLAGPLVDVLAQGIRLVIVHGNGPQVGGRLIQDEAARNEVPPTPLHVCVAETQGQIGHYLTLAIQDELQQRGLQLPVACLLTHVLVDPDAPEFKQPDKPVGPIYADDAARDMTRERGWRMARVPEGGWRRVVPSPRPLDILEEQAIRLLLDAGWCVIAGGGGGIPLARGSDGRLRGVDAVVDKDYVAERLATAVGASRLIVLTDVPGAALAFDSKQRRFLDRTTANEAHRYLDEGQFAAGSMRPKVEACTEFLAHGGREATIAATEDAAAAFEGRAGTRITSG